MIQIDDTIISMDLFEKQFCCDLSDCKGICCIEGDSGAPLEESEVPILEKILPVVWDDLSDKSKAVIEKQGVSYIDIEGDRVTSIVDGCECVFTYLDENGVCKCAIEKAYREGKIDFYKPISCHLYPVRLENLRNGTVGINIHRWKVCKAAFEQGRKCGLPVYQFLKEPLIRRFGAEWYEKVCIAAEEIKKMNK
ncbi:MAG: DUF3109 family protein [Paludibacteraceae bacterium]|nr:DUF3109 family protein [Paludibacteraceae bacterium]MEE3482949.1 DUF3109 family protein [Bacteroidales bacterium]